MPPSDESPKMVGLCPKYIHDECRYEAILDAIDRYRNAKYIIPTEWIEELLDLSRAIEVRRKEKSRA